MTSLAPAVALTVEPHGGGVVLGVRRPLPSYPGHTHSQCITELYAWLFIGANAFLMFSDNPNNEIRVLSLARKQIVSAQFSQSLLHGVVAYALSLGQRPFSKRSALALMYIYTYSVCLVG